MSSSFLLKVRATEFLPHPPLSVSFVGIQETIQIERIKSAQAPSNLCYKYTIFFLKCQENEIVKILVKLFS